MKTALLFPLAFCLVVSGHPARRADFTLANGQKAIALNEQFKQAKDGGPCTPLDNGVGCVGTKFAQCVNGKIVSTPCAAGTTCAALPKVNSPGTSVACEFPDQVKQRIADTGANAGAPPANNGKLGNNQPNNGQSPAQGDKGKVGNGNGGGDAQTSLTLDPRVIAKGFAKTGQETPTPGQVASLTSTNNFINFCLTAPNFPITDGKQIKTGSCNPAPIGLIPSVDNMPSVKFAFPRNNEVIGEGQPFTIKLATKNLQAGNFVNAQTNYFAAPQQLNKQGLIIGHSHVVVEKVALDSTTPTDPRVFTFFKGVNDPADAQGILSVSVDKGLPAGAYRLMSIVAAANHQPCIVPVAQRGSLDDAVYFTVGQSGGNNKQGGKPAQKGGK